MNVDFVCVGLILLIAIFTASGVWAKTVKERREKANAENLARLVAFEEAKRDAEKSD